MNQRRPRANEDLMDFLQDKKEKPQENSLKRLMKDYGDEEKLLEDLGKEKDKKFENLDELF